MIPSGTMVQGNILYVFYTLPFHYGYTFMKEMADVMVNNILNKKVSSFQICDIPGMKPKDISLSVKFHGFAIEKCGILKRECGVMCVRGECCYEKMPREVGLTLLNQTNQIRLSIVNGNNGDLSFLNTMVEDLLKQTRCNNKPKDWSKYDIKL